MAEYEHLNVRQVVGRNVRAARQAHALRQEDIAKAAKRYGLTWGRSSVSALESGKRALSVEELLALPAFLTAAIQAASRARSGGGESLVALGGVTLAELLTPPPGAVLHLTYGLLLRAIDVPSLLRDRALPSTFELPTIITDADRHAARRLGVEPDVVIIESFNLWGRSLEDERDAFLTEQGAESLGPESMRAFRAHATRMLLAELARRLFHDKSITAKTADDVIQGFRRNQEALGAAIAERVAAITDTTADFRREYPDEMKTVRAIGGELEGIADASNSTRSAQGRKGKP